MTWRPLLLAAVLAGGLVAQPARQERRTVALHAGLLHELWRAARALAPERVVALDDALAERPTGNPFGPVVEALARRDGVEGDIGYVTRRMLHVVALPEVVDPTVFEDETDQVPYRLHVTLATPFVLAAPAPLAFSVELHDAAGKAVRRQRIEAATAAELGQLAVKLAVPVADLADGRYAVVVRADVGEHAWQEGDPVARADVFVQRGFAQSTRVLDARARDLLAAAEPAQRGALRGALWPLQRVYGGDAFEGHADFLADQRNAGRVLENLAAERAPLDGVEGFCAVAVELGPGEPPPHVRLRVRAAAGGSGAAAGLVLFIPGDPTWDGVWSRPSLARSTAPGFLASALALGGFDAERRFHLAVMESPGDLRAPRDAVRAVVDALGELLPVDGARIVLVGEREGASAILAAWQSGALASAPRGVALAVHAGIGRGDAERIAASSLLLVPGRGHASAENLARAAAQLAEAGAGEHVRLLEATHAWPWALLQALPQVEKFCAERLR